MCDVKFDFFSKAFVTSVLTKIASDETISKVQHSRKRICEDTSRKGELGFDAVHGNPGPKVGIRPLASRLFS